MKDTPYAWRLPVKAVERWLNRAIWDIEERLNALSDASPEMGEEEIELRKIHPTLVSMSFHLRDALRNAKKEGDHNEKP